ncbi:hydroxymethylglutaryl-coenzyme A reductase [Fusarium albosuccineum]|uniref:hydroxymethylglutaryl-CoA reductase (NADPH) n=1 Tax=Fusarium albosuccineum TaxID=1237068 RepID=A0A8H4P517_9HYPO|nr:hydroxymethylglutaryl-coenzyme A reductase [Fusarium albosuccineum]
MVSSNRPKSEALCSVKERFIRASEQQEERAHDLRIENPVGFCKIPLGVAGPLRVANSANADEIYAPLATYEATLVASYAQQWNVTISGICFYQPNDAIAFVKDLPSMQDRFTRWAEGTSSHVKLQGLKPAIIGSQVHLFCNYDCGLASGQNMVTKATQFACDMLMEAFAERYRIKDFLVEGQLASDKKPSWGNVGRARGVEVLVWGKITQAACQYVLGCTTQRLYMAQQTLKEGGIRNGQFGSNFNTANILAAMFISTGQDPASTAEASWSHLTSELDAETGDLKMSLFFPSLPVGTVGGGTGFAMQKEALKVLQCDNGEPGDKPKLAGIIAAFALALDASTSAAIANNTFTASHMRLARGEVPAKL